MALTWPDRARQARPERDPGADPENLFYAGAVFGYQDAARCMGLSKICILRFVAWMGAVGFEPTTQVYLSSIYRKAYYE